MDRGDEPSFFCRNRAGRKIEIKNIPAGTYELEAWHDRLRGKTMTVTVTDNSTQKIDFTFTEPNSGNMMEGGLWV